jgi:hypothetical protein
MGTKTQKLSNVVDQIVEWQSVFTGDGSTGLTAVAGRGYFIDTTSGTVTVTLPASPKAGDIVQLKDYARTWGTNAVSIASTTFDGVSNNPSFSTNGQTVTLVYMDGTKGWSLINDDTTTGLGAEFISATGGTVTESGDYKIHTFTGDGCFVVSCAGNPSGSTAVDYLVVAGGGGGGECRAGGGGAGGFRESHSTPVSGCYTASPLVTPTGITVSATTYPVTVGGGGAGSTCRTINGVNGSNSVFSTITSTGGGGGAGDGSLNGSNGGSGGGAANSGTKGSGNTPPTSPAQGFDGGCSTSGWTGSGGGGAAGAGTTAGPCCSPGPGGAGVATLINPATGESGPGPSQYYAGGGGGGGAQQGGPGAPAGTGGVGGGGDGTGPGDSTGGAGTANTGGGGGGNGGPSGCGAGGAGGKGIVIIRYKFQ